MKNKIIIKDRWYNKFVREAVPEIIKIFKPKNIIIFGSRIKANASSESDIDVILVSEVFKDVKFLERMPFVLKRIRFPKHVDYLCYTAQELNRIKDQSYILTDALSEGIDVLCPSGKPV